MKPFKYRVSVSRPSIAIEIAQTRANITGCQAYIVLRKGDLFVQDGPDVDSEVLESFSPQEGEEL